MQKRLTLLGGKIHHAKITEARLNADDMKDYRPKVVFVDGNNKATKIGHYEEHGTIAE